MNAKDEIILSFAGIADGQIKTSQLCPKCKGGSKQERSLSVGRAGIFLWWRCHRASCGFVDKQAVTRSGEVEDLPTTTDQKRGRFRSFKRTALPNQLAKQLAKRFCVEPETFSLARWSYTPDYDGHGPRVIMPIFRLDGTIRGELFRSYSGYEPKALINIELAENAICWYRFKKYCSVLVIVEDQPSALKIASAGLHSLALLGTTLTVDRIKEIRQGEYKHVFLCLDQDATSAAVKYLTEFRSYLPSMKVKSLDRDVKDMDQKEFDLFIQEIITQD